MENRPRLQFGDGVKLLRPMVCLAMIGIRYEKFVQIVAVAVIAVNATTDPITAHEMAILSMPTRIPALTAILSWLSLRMYLDPGSTPSRAIAYVTR